MATPGSQHNVLAAKDHRVSNNPLAVGLRSSSLPGRQLVCTLFIAHPINTADLGLSLHICYKHKITIETIHQLIHLKRAQKCPQQGLGEWPSITLYWTTSSSQEVSTSFPKKRPVTPLRVNESLESVGCLGGAVSPHGFFRHPWY